MRELICQHTLSTCQDRGTVVLQVVLLPRESNDISGRFCGMTNMFSPNGQHEINAKCIWVILE